MEETEIKLTVDVCTGEPEFYPPDGRYLFYTARAGYTEGTSSTPLGALKELHEQLERIHTS